MLEIIFSQVTLMKLPQNTSGKCSPQLEVWCRVVLKAILQSELDDWLLT